MRVSTIASAIALCALASPALATPLEARDVRTTTKTKTVVETQTVELPRKTQFVTETVTLPRKTQTIYSTSFETDVETVTKLRSASTVTVSKSASTVTLTQKAEASTISVHLPASTVTFTQKALTVTLTQKLPASTTSIQLAASTVTLTQKAPVFTTSTQLPASTVTLTQKAPASTTSIQLPASTVTLTQRLPASTTSIHVPASTQIVTTSVPITRVMTTTIFGKASTVVSTVSLPRLTVTEPPTTLTTSLPAQTQTVYVNNNATMTSWLTSACSSPTTGSFPTMSPGSNGTTAPNGSVPTGSSSSSSPTTQEQYINVITTSCADPKAYYLQISAPGTEIDGTVAMGSISDSDYGDMYMQPVSSNSDFTPLPYVFDPETGYLSSYYNAEFTLAAYNYTQDNNDFRGMIESFPFDYGYASNLQCKSEGGEDTEKKVLDCGTLFDGEWHGMNKVVEAVHTVPARWFAYLEDTTYDGGQAAYDAGFSLVPACDI